MCGIFGFAGEWSLRSALLLQALAIADEIRGRHSTGLAIAAKRKDCRSLKPLLVKKAISGSGFVRDGYTRFLFKNKYNLAIGHNRYATAGEVTDRNAHPFRLKLGQLTAYAAHNGSVAAASSLARTFDTKNCAVDSETMFRAIAGGGGRTEKAFLDSVEKVVRTMGRDANYACLWMIPARRRTYLWRNEGRPLAIFDARRVGLGRFFSSTVEIFSTAWGLLRGYLPSISKVSYFDAKPFRIYRVEDDGKFEVEGVRDVSGSKQRGYFQRKVRSQAVPRAEKSLFEDLEDSDTDNQEVLCRECGGDFPACEAVYLCPETGRTVSSELMGRPHHAECAYQVQRRFGSEEVA